jgi:tetratricopeptide (TPR) repeat protein
MTSYLREELKKAILTSSPKPLVVCGAGVSTQATNGLAPLWSDLIHSGIKRASDIDSNANSWAMDAAHRLKTGNSEIWTIVADEVTNRLGGAHNAEFSTWLKDEIAGLRPTNRDLVDAVFSLGCPIATTNYDDILEQASGLPQISWSDHVGTHEFLYAKRPGILHLHGHWRSPADVVLGARSYGEHFSDQRRRLLQDIASLDRPTVFIGCSQDGINDPDFSRLDSFLREWQDIAPRRYWLIRQDIHKDGSKKPLPSPIHERRLYPIAFGESYSELAPFLRSFSQSILPSDVDMDAAFRCINEYEPKAVIFGRENEVETIIRGIQSRRPVIVAGGPGMGKTAVAIASLYDPRIVTSFSRRRVFASLESAVEPRELLARLVDAIGIPPTGDERTLLRILEANAAERGIVAIIDNAETIFDVDWPESERLLTLATQIPNLSLVMTIRGVPPPVPNSVSIGELTKLDATAARSAFVAIAGASFESDPDLNHLLNALDGHALSIRLVAAQASGSPSLKGLRESWDDAHAEILRRPGERESRLTSVRTSLALSVNGRRMKETPLARRLLSLVAYLPGGLSEDAVRLLLGDRGTVSRLKANDAVACLNQLRLIEHRADRHMRMLTPLRECVKIDVLPVESDQKRLINFYLTIVKKAAKIGRKQWPQVRNEVEAEADNLDPICELAVVTDINNPHIVNALVGLADFNNVSGKAGIESIRQANNRLSLKPPSQLSAFCKNALGRTAVAHGKIEFGESFYKEALSHFKSIKNNAGAANAISALGGILHGRSKDSEARARFEEALVLFRKINQPLGEANCIRRLAKIFLENSDPENARPLYKEALELSKSVGDTMGEANSIRRLGEIASQSGDLDHAQERYNEALPLYRDIGDNLDEANCILDLADVDHFRSNDDEAIDKVRHALLLYRRVGNLAGEAGANFSSGTYYLFLSNFDQAIDQFEKALTTFESLSMPGGEAIAKLRLGQAQQCAGKGPQGYGNIQAGFATYFQFSNEDDRALPGWRALHQALICDEPVNAATHREIAGNFWKQIGRLDLFYNWIGFIPGQSPVSKVSPASVGLDAKR